MTEFSLIDRHFRPLTKGFSPALDLRDDAASFAVPPMHDLVVTKDILISGIHFFPHDDPKLIAQKSLRVNLSDLFAKGAAPYGYLIGFNIPKTPPNSVKNSWWLFGNRQQHLPAINISDDWMAKFANGLAEDQNAYGIRLMGGDTTSGGNQLMISITAFGLVPKNQMILRSAAKPGDIVCVTGRIGDAGLGLGILQNRWPITVQDEKIKSFLQRYYLPQPRAKIMAALRQAGAVHAAADISDGLLADLGHILSASGVGARLESGLIPISAAAKEFINNFSLSLEDVFSAGDDYEIIFTCPPERIDLVFQLSPQIGIEVTRIGIITHDTKLEIYDDKGGLLAWTKRGFQHHII